MYKKITHNIVEEHFDHPMTLPMDIQWPAPPYKNVYVANLRNQFTQYNTDLRSSIKSAVSNANDLEFNTTQLTITSNGLVPFFAPYFGQDNAQTIANYFSSYALSMLDIVKSVLAGTEFSIQQANSLSYLLNLVKLLDGIYPDWWTPLNITPQIYMTNYNQTMVQQIVSRQAINWEDDYKAAQLASTILCSPGNNPPPYYTNQDLVSVLGNSIIRKFPLQFT